MWEGEDDLQMVLCGYMYIAIPKLPEAHGVRASITWSFHHIGMLIITQVLPSIFYPSLSMGAA